MRGMRGRVRICPSFAYSDHRLAFTLSLTNSTGYCLVAFRSTRTELCRFVRMMIGGQCLSSPYSEAATGPLITSICSTSAGLRLPRPITALSTTTPSTIITRSWGTDAPSMTTVGAGTGGGGAVANVLEQASSGATATSNRKRSRMDYTVNRGPDARKFE